MRRFMFAVSIAFLTLFGFMTSTLWGELTKENVLIKKVITREYSVLVGTTGPNEIKEMVSLEVSLFIGEDASPHNQIISRETIVVVASDAPPTPITTELSVTVSPTGETVILDWSDYKQWAEKDIDHFDIYYTAKGPFDTVPAQGLNVNSVRTESTSKTIEFLPAFTDHYFAVVPVDALGNYYTQVNYSASYVLSPEVISREASLFIGEDASPHNQIISRETIVVVASDAPPTPITTELSVTVSPTGETVILDWSDYKQWAEKDIDHFDIYYTAKGPFDTVPAQGLNVNSVRTESTSKTIEFLPAFTDHYFAVVPVDALGYYYTQVSYSASYVLSPEVISREASLFIGEDASPYNQIISREISILTPDSKIPEQIPVTGHDDGFYVVTSPNKYSAVEMDWTIYDEYAQNDVVQYNIYYNTKYFGSIDGMTPFKIVPAETRKFTLAGLECDAIFHFAVVAVDSLGNFDSKVSSFSMKVSTCFLGEVKNLTSESGANRVNYSWDPPDAESFLSYYNVYFGGSSTAVKLAVGQKYWTATELLAATSYHFQVKTVDIFGNESGGTSIISATYLPNPSNVTIIGVGTKAVLLWDHVEPISLKDHYAIYQSQDPITDVSGLSPIATRNGRSIPLGLLETVVGQYFAVATVNVSGGQDPSVVSILATKQIVNYSKNLEYVISVLKLLSDVSCNESEILDVDNNGKVEISDAIILLKHATDF